MGLINGSPYYSMVVDIVVHREDIGEVLPAHAQGWVVSL